MPSSASTPRIVVVEADESAALKIENQLYVLGYQPVGLARSGEEAIEMVGALRPDLVIIASRPHGKLQPLTTANAIGDQYRLPIVMLSANAAEHDLVHLELKKKFSYLVEPFSDRELQVVVDMAIYKHSAEARLLDADRYATALLEQMTDGVVTINERGHIEMFNEAACRIFGYRAEEVIGNNISMLMPEPHRSRHDGYIARYTHTGEERMIGVPRELEGMRKDGTLFPMSLAVSQLAHDSKVIFVGVVRDISQRLQGEETIRHLAYFDELTKLPNRRLLMDQVSQVIATSAHTHSYSALLYMDIDNFKQINDSSGHVVGDHLLAYVSERLLGCMNAHASVARVGGDEFMVVLDSLSGDYREAASRAEAVSAGILEAVRTPVVLDGRTIAITASIGIVLFQGIATDPNTLLKEADIAMYEAKSSGRNCSRFFDPAMQAALDEHANLIDEMRLGLERDEFVVYYQPQVDRYGITAGVEALVRWDNPRRGLVSPAQFIPNAEQSGLIIPMGALVLQIACHQLRLWSERPETSHWTMAVNVSSLQFEEAGFLDTVTTALLNSGANPHLLKLELTESILVQNVDELVIKMNEIKALGVRFSLDDFGTGFSSLSYLKMLPLHQLKIDQSFIRDILTDPNDSAIARTVLALGHILGLQVIAEGVETAEQRDVLVAMGCDAFQGYLFGKPVPAEALAVATEAVVPHKRTAGGEIARSEIAA